MCNHFYGELQETTREGMSAWDERTSLPISLGIATLYPFTTRYNSMVDMTETSKTFLFGLHEANLYNFFETAIGYLAVKQ